MKLHQILGLWGHRIFRVPPLNGIHRLTQHCYKKYLNDYIVKFFSHNTDVLKVFPRHSVNSSSFNVFYSDYDFTIIVKDGYSQNNLEKDLKRLNVLKGKIKIIDYPEVYTESEYKIYKDLLNDEVLDDLFTFLRCLRKLRWEFDALNNSENQYEINKHFRSLENIFKKTASPINVEDFFISPVFNLSESRFNYIIPTCNIPSYPHLLKYESAYLYEKVSIDPKNEADVCITGNEYELLVLTALMPEPIIVSNDKLNAHIQRIRYANNEIRGHYIKLLFLEVLLCRSSYRTACMMNKAKDIIDGHKKAAADYFDRFIHEVDNSVFEDVLIREISRLQQL